MNHELTSSSDTDVRRTDAVRAVVRVDCAEMIASLRANASACCGETFGAAASIITGPSAKSALRAAFRTDISFLPHPVADVGTPGTPGRLATSSVAPNRA